MFCVSAVIRMAPRLASPNTSHSNLWSLLWLPKPSRKHTFPVLLPRDFNLLVMTFIFTRSLPFSWNLHYTYQKPHFIFKRHFFKVLPQHSHHHLLPPPQTHAKESMDEVALEKRWNRAFIILRLCKTSIDLFCTLMNLDYIRMEQSKTVIIHYHNSTVAF